MIPKPTEDQLKELRARFHRASSAAKKVLKPGDRIRVSKCPGTKRVITFAGWDGEWIVSRSGINDYSPSCVDMVNGRPVDFGKANTTMSRAHLKNPTAPSVGATTETAGPA